MKKRCNGCRALEIIINGYSLYYKCDLKFSMYNNIPRENCPKPKTYSEYFNLKEKQNEKD